MKQISTQVKTTERFWQKRQNMTVRFERHEIDNTTLVFGERKA